MIISGRFVGEERLTTAALFTIWDGDLVFPAPGSPQPIDRFPHAGCRGTEAGMYRLLPDSAMTQSRELMILVSDIERGNLQRQG